MKRIIFALMSIILFGCQQAREGYYIYGEAEGFEDGTMIQIAELGEILQPVTVDSTAIQNGEFSLDLPEVDQPKLNFLSVRGLPGNVMFISENTPIKFELYKDSLQASKVSGGPQNEAFYTYIDHLKEVNRKVMELRTELQMGISSGADSSRIAELQNLEEEIRNNDLEYRKKLVKDNPNKFVSILVLTDLLNMGAATSELRSLYATVSENLKTGALAQALKENLDQQSAVDIGSKAPEFSGPNPEGEEIALKDVMGKVTLIDFWAAWCKPCRIENPNVVRIYQKYHNKGFNIVGISLDREDQRDRWLQAIEDDNLTWPQISHLQSWQEPIARMYNVKAIPAQFILDENGVIVAKNLRGDDLEAKVKELLEK